MAKQTQLEVIQNFMAYLDTVKTVDSKITSEEAVDKAINKVCSYIYGFQNSTSRKGSLKDAFMTDLRSTSSVEDFLRIYCGILFNTADSGAITGSDAGGKTSKTEADIIKESGDLDTSFKSNSFTVNNLVVKLADNKAFSSLSDSEKFIWRGLKTWWVKGALDLISDSLGENFSFTNYKASKITNKTPTTNKLYIEFIDDADSEKVFVSAPEDKTVEEVTELNLTINMHYYKSLKDNLETANTEFDRAIAKEMTNAVVMANIYYSSLYRLLPGFITEGLAELVIGITNTNAEQIKSLTADTTKFEVGLDINDLARDESFMYEGGYIFFRYMARQFGDLTIANSKTANTLIQTFYGDDTITNSVGNVTITSGHGDNSITNSASNVTITSGLDDDSIKTAGDNVSIFSSGGNNYISISGSASNNGVLLGSGKDTIYLSDKTTKTTINSGSGKDYIISRGTNILINAEEGDDYISLYSGAHNNTVNGGKGKDYIECRSSYNLINGEAGNEHITLYSGTSNNTINGGEGKNYIYIYENSSDHTVTCGDDDDTVHNEGSNVFVETGDGKDIVQFYSKDSSAKNNTVNSGDGDDSIYSGGENNSVNAGSGDDYIHIYSTTQDNTVNAGAGNDTIESYCENGVLYQYANGDGDDSIKGFNAKDTIRISNGTYSTAKSGSDILITVGNGIITLENAASFFTARNITDSSSGGGSGGGSSTSSGGGSSSSSTLISVTDSTSSPVTVGSAVKIINASKRTKAVKITANKLANTITGGTNNDTIDGGAGNDSIVAGAGNDSVFGGAGNDRIYGNDGDDKLIGGAGNDSIRGNAGADTLWGGSGNDTLSGGDGNDLFLYSAGNDIITDYATGDKISLGAAISKATVSGSDVIFTFDSNTLTVKEGKGKSLSMINSAGNSFSTIISGELKTLTVTNSTKSPVTVDSSYGVINASTRTTAVNITGNALDNTISGGTKNDTILGGAGNDSIVGNAGNDSIFGNAGNDKLYGSAGNDKLYGGDGNDSLWGGAGNDSLWGNAGDDTFIYANKSGKDVIYGFEDGDLLQITGTSSFSGTYNKSKKEIYFKVGSTAAAITLKNFTATNFSVNGTSYKVSGTKLVKS